MVPQSDCDILVTLIACLSLSSIGKAAMLKLLTSGRLVVPELSLSFTSSTVELIVRNIHGKRARATAEEPRLGIS
jgi:hypothetical protein